MARRRRWIRSHGRSNLYFPKGQLRRALCRICGREVRSCVHCRRMMCWECSTNAGRCESCQRPQKPAATSTLPQAIARLVKGNPWMSEPYIANWLGVSRRDIRRAVKKHDRLQERRSSFWKRGGRRLIYLLPEKADE